MGTTEPAAPVCVEPLEVRSTERNERKTKWVVLVTLAMMGMELLVGWWSRSLALVADGWHMGTHAGALGLSLFAYWYARTRKRESSYAFGTGKVFALAGYTNALLLLGVALFMAYEAIERLLHPVTVHFQEALPVAVLGLVVNLVSAALLHPEEESSHEEHSHKEHSHAHDHHAHEHHGHDHHHHDDHNLRGAYLHVIADALTSITAILALLGAQYFRWGFLDPLMAMLGSLLIVQWAFGLLRSSAKQLVDATHDPLLARAILARVETLGPLRVQCLHLWRPGSGELACLLRLEHDGSLDAAQVRSAIRNVAPVVHLTVELCATGQGETV